MNEINKTEWEHNGHRITVRWFHDMDMGEPWNEDDGHGIVSDWTRRDKRPGEMVLCEDGRARRFYDFKASMEKAKREGWGCAGEFKTEGEKLHAAVMADFKHLKAWCDNRCHWVFYSVTIEALDNEGDAVGEMDYQDSCGGIESGCMAHFDEQAINAATAWIDGEIENREKAACADIATI